MHGIIVRTDSYQDRCPKSFRFNPGRKTMMKSILKMILILAVASLTSVTFAGQKFLRYSYYISVYDGNNHFTTSKSCSEYPDGNGGTIRSWEIWINANLNGNDIYENENDYVPGLCPKDDNFFGGNSKQSITISFKEYVVTANCSDQITAHGSSTELVKYPGQNKSIKYSSHFKKHYNDNPSNMSCVATVTHSGSLPEAFDDSIYVRAERALTNQTN